MIYVILSFYPNMGTSSPSTRSPVTDSPLSWPPGSSEDDYTKTSDEYLPCRGNKCLYDCYNMESGLNKDQLRPFSEHKQTIRAPHCSDAGDQVQHLSQAIVDHGKDIATFPGSSDVLLKY